MIETGKTSHPKTSTKILRPNLGYPRIGEITQGTIFNCASAFRYTNRPVHGLTITARCDVAQNKYRLLNYVPVVRLEDWLKVDGLEILVDLEKKDQQRKIENTLKNAGVSASLLRSVSLIAIIDEHFPANTTKKPLRDGRKLLEGVSDDITKLNASTQDPDRCLDWLTKNRPKKVRELIARLFRHDVLGNYFLERLSIDTPVDGHVCLLREVTSLPRETVEELARGLTEARWQERYRSTGSSQLDFTHDNLAMPIYQLTSPTIEHIMQTYANLFGRIGIEDPDEKDIDLLCDKYCALSQKDES